VFSVGETTLFDDDEDDLSIDELTPDVSERFDGDCFYDQI
jgi:hypothetical protein